MRIKRYQKQHIQVPCLSFVLGETLFDTRGDLGGTSSSQFGGACKVLRM